MSRAFSRRRFDRRQFIQSCAATAAAGPTFAWLCSVVQSAPTAASELAEVAPPLAAEDVFAFIRRARGRHDEALYAQILGAANEFKEGDAIVGVAAASDASRSRARAMLAETTVADIDRHALHQDDLFQYALAARDPAPIDKTAAMTLGELKSFLLEEDESAIQRIMPGLSSDVIACVVKLLDNAQLIQIGSKIFNPLPNSQLGARGYLGARIQPNSPTDHPDDIFWQVLDGWSFGVGDLLLGTNPVSSEVDSVLAIQLTLQDLLETFALQDSLPHCVLAHIDVQAAVEQARPGSTALWFQSIAGNDSANKTFDISIEKMRDYARTRSGKYGLYFETGQGADFTNGHSHGFDMVLHESRKYGLARALSKEVAAAQRGAGNPEQPWVHVNDVAGFIGPEVFRLREQLVRCCLEDIVMGKLHGLCLGLDVCSTLHMDVTLADLDWCLDQVMPACPAYLMALPTKIDPMLGYLTTGFQDHVRLREKFGTKVNDAMATFFQQLGVVDSAGRPTSHFGDPCWVYLQYCRKKNDPRPDHEILAEGRERIAQVRGRGLFIAEGYGAQGGELAPGLQQEIQRIYDDAKASIWAELDAEFVRTIPASLQLKTESTSREDYILHPTSGERLSGHSLELLGRLRKSSQAKDAIQIVISDGLNALSIRQPGQLLPFLKQLRESMERSGLRAAPEHLVVFGGRVRAGYQVGETLFGGHSGLRTILHIIGERPGSGHRTFSVYLTTASGTVWGRPGTVDHDITKVVSGIATTALDPKIGAEQVVRLLLNA